MIRVLNIISDTNIGGAGRALLTCLSRMDRESFEAAVLLPTGSLLKDRVAALDIPVFEIDAMQDRSFDRRAIRLQQEVIREYDPQIVHTHGSLSGRVAGKRLGKKVVFTRHSAFPFPGWVQKPPARWVYRYLYDHYADRIVVISPAGAKLLTDIGVPESKLDVMMNGVDPVPRASEDVCRELRRRYGIREGDFTVGVMARIEEYKGHLDILEAVRRLADRGVSVKLLIAGTGGFEDAVRARAAELGLGETAVFMGFVQDMALPLSLMDVQLNASTVSEACSMSLLEGMSMGVPMVVSDCSGNPWTVDDGVTGFLFPPGDPEALADRLLRLTDGTLRRIMGQNARRAYEERFTGEIFTRRVEDVYRRAIAGSGKETP